MAADFGQNHAPPNPESMMTMRKKKRAPDSSGAAVGSGDAL
jgi:hypothetical protein